MQRKVYKYEDGLIIVRAADGIFYIRHDIIFAKSGDVFYMPRKVPADFNIHGDNTIAEGSELFEMI